MVNYKCIRCGYDTNHKSKMNLHLSRKTMCKPILDDIILDDYKQDILNGKIIILEKNKIPPKSPQKPQNPPNPPKNPKKPQNPPKKNYNCNYCKKKYSTNYHLHRHIKICKEKKKDDECKKDMIKLVKKPNDQLNEELKKRDNQLLEQKKELKYQKEEHQKQINQLIKKVGITQNIQNIQNNIKILAYKNTDLSHLTDKDYMYCLNRSNMCIPHLIKRIHFDPKKPENHNIYISNIKNKYIMIYDGNKWYLNDQDETIDDIIDTNEFVLEQKLEEWIEKGKDYPEIMRKFNRYLEKKEKDEVINKIKDEIKLLLYNNRKVTNDQIDI